MKNPRLEEKAKVIVNTPSVIIRKGTVGGNSIETYTEQPYEDLGSFIYKTEKDRNLDFDELMKMKS